MAVEAVAARARAGKYLTFFLGNEEYGLEILKVRELIGLQSITHVPRTPEYVLGVINLRGKVIPTIDLRTKFGLDRVDTTEETCIIVVYVGQVEVGIVVDKVSEVMDIEQQSIEETPSFGADVDTSFILGMGKIGNTVVTLLDIECVIDHNEVCQLARQD